MRLIRLCALVIEVAALLIGLLGGQALLVAWGLSTALGLTPFWPTFYASLAALIPLYALLVAKLRQNPL